MFRILTPLSGLAVSALLLACMAPTASAMDGSNGITSVTDAPPASDVGGKILADKDFDFINQAASAGKFEISAAQYVLALGLVGNAKTFAQSTAADHFVIANRLKDLLQKQGIAIPERMTFDDRVQFAKLKDTREDQLGKTYVDGQVKALVAAVALFTDEAANGQDAALRAFAQSNLPLLKEHLDHAQTVAGAGEVQ